jgi:hypothetical protein
MHWNLKLSKMTVLYSNLNYKKPILKILYYKLFLFFSVLANPLFAQNLVTDSTAEVVAYWKPGDKKKLELTTAREKYVNNNLVLKTTSTSEILMSVIEESGLNYKIEWHYLNTVVNESEEEIVKRLAEISNDFKITYRTSETGQFESLENYKEMEQFYAKGMQKMTSKYGSDSVNQQLYKVLSQIFATKSGVDASFTKEPKLYHFPYGAEYKLNETVNEIATLPHPFSNDTIQVLIDIKLIELDSSNMTCKLQLTKDISKEKAQNIIDKYVMKMQQQDPSFNEKKLNIAVFEVHDETIYNVELAKGWIKEVIFLQTTFYDFIKQVDSYTIKMTEGK